MDGYGGGGGYGAGAGGGFGGPQYAEGEPSQQIMVRNVCFFSLFSWSERRVSDYAFFRVVAMVNCQ